MTGRALGGFAFAAALVWLAMQAWRGSPRVRRHLPASTPPDVPASTPPDATPGDRRSVRERRGLLAAGDRCGLLDRLYEHANSPRGCDGAHDALRAAERYRGPKWTQPPEPCLLYLLGGLSGGAIAEQGPFLGASTIAIAAGLRDSARPGRLFLSADAFPAPASATADGSKHEYPHFWRHLREDERPAAKRGSKDGAVAMHIDGVVRGTLPLSVYNRAVRPYNEGAMGQMGALLSNLRAAGVDHLVSVLTGSSVPRAVPFEVVWSDSTHNLAEIRATVPAHLAVANESRGECVTFAWHDINPEFEPRVVRLPAAVPEATTGLWNEKRRAIEQLIDAAGCTVVRRAAGGFIYSVTIKCQPEPPS